MPRQLNHSSDDEEPLEDKTATLKLRSKRTERQQRKQTKRDRKREAIANLSKLPTELIIECLKVLKPGDVLNFGFVNRRFRSLVDANADIIGESIIKQRYSLLSKCFPLPKLLVEVDASVRPLLVDDRRRKQLGIHHRLYQHVEPPDPQLLCTCLTCIMTWNNLCVTLDFAHWQSNLDHGEPIPMISRGQRPEWNQQLVRRNAAVVRTALQNSLWHARIMEIHLESTICAIRRHGKNEGNKRKHVEMTDGEAALGTDDFLTKPGPPSLEFPYHRDNYYLLEAYLPNRYWLRDQQRWVYTVSGQHERDLELVVRFAKR